MFCLIELNPLLVTDGSRPTLRACSGQHPALTGASGERWLPAVSKSPSLGLQLFDGDFTSSVNPGTATFTLKLNTLAAFGLPIGDYRWASAGVTIYAVPNLAAGDRATKAIAPEVAFVGKVSDFNDQTSPDLAITASVDTTPFDANAMTLTYAGTGGAEGGADLAGKLKPWLLGRAENVEPTLIDSDNSVMQFSAYGQIKAVDVLYERGSDFGASMGDFATYDALVAADIPAGKWATCLAHGMIRLGAPPYGVITGDVQGDQPAPGNFPQTTGAIIQRIATNAGVDEALIDVDSLTGLDALVPYPINIVLTDQASVLDLAQQLAQPCNAIAGVNWLGELFVTRVALTDPILTLDARGRQLPVVKSCSETSVSPPYKRIIMGAQQCWRVQTFDEIAFEAPLIDRGLYADGTTYREGNIVELADGSRWLYTATAATAGNAPAADSDYWTSLNGPTVVDWSTGVAGAGKPEDGATVGAPGDTPVGSSGHTGDDISGALTGNDGQLVQIVDVQATIAQAQSDIDDLTATYGDTESAEQAKEAAQAAQTAAEANAQAAQQSATDADGSATTASGQATIATQQATDAGQFATNAQASADTASTKAGEASVSQEHAAVSEANALGYSNQAGSYSTVAANSSQQALETAASQLPSDFKQGSAFWSSVYSGPVTRAPAFDPGVWTFDGSGALFTNNGLANGTLMDVSNLGSVRLVPGHRRRITAIWQIINSSGLTSVSGTLYFITLDDNESANGGNPGINIQINQGDPGWSATGGYAQHVFEWNDSDLIATAVGTTRIRALFRYSVGGATDQFKLVDLILADITESTAAASSAAAAAGDASTAQTSSDQAGQSATAANQAKLDAQAANTDAQAAATSAQGSATTATSKAAEASSNATLAASYQTGAQQQVASTLPSDFSAGFAFWDPGYSGPPTRNDGFGATWSLQNGDAVWANNGTFGNGSSIDCAHLGAQKLVPGRRHRISATYLIASAGAAPSVEFFIYAIGLNGSYQANYTPGQAITFNGGAGWGAAAGFRTDTFEFNDDDMIAQGSIYIRGLFRFMPNYQSIPGWNGADSFILRSLNLEDITSETASASSASTATSQAAIATAEAAAAQTSATLAARVGTQTINQGATFTNWPDPANYPAYWGAWGNFAATRVSGLVGAYGLQQAVPAGSGDWGIVATIDTDPAFKGLLSGEYVVTADVVLDSGTFLGSGILLRALDASGNLLWDNAVHFYFEPSAQSGGSAATGAGLPGGRYQFAIPASLPVGVSTVQFFLMSQWSGFSADLPAKTITWHECGFRAATPAEIKSGQIDSLSATVSQQAGVIADLQTKTATAYVETTASVPGAEATVQIVATTSDGSPASAINLAADAVTLGNQRTLEVDDDGVSIIGTLTIKGIVQVLDSNGTARLKMGVF